MESILRGIAASQHPDALKTQLLKQLLLGMNLSSLDPETVSGCLNLFIEWALASDNPVLIQMGHLQFRRFAEARSPVFLELLRPNYMIDHFTNPFHVNKSELPAVICCIFCILAELLEVQQRPELERSLINVVKGRLVTLMKEHGVHLDVAASLSKLYSVHPCLLASPSECHIQAVLVVKLLAGYKMPSPSQDEHFVEMADSVAKLLPILWAKSSEPDRCTLECLRHFYTLISSADSYSMPSCALLSVIDVTPLALMENCMQQMLSKVMSSAAMDTCDDAAPIVSVLKTMLTWLSQRPSVTLSDWAMKLMVTLNRLKKKSILIEVAHFALDKLLSSLLVPELAEGVEDLFFYLLLGYQHSQLTPFFKILHRLPGALDQVRGANKRLYLRLSEATAFLIALFPANRHLFDHVGLLDLPTPDASRCDELSNCAWLTFTAKASGSVQSSLSNDGWMQSQSYTGLIGLSNLGNTCYCNSVIQALYMTKDLVDIVMSASISPCQVVLYQLQVSFAFLAHSLRPIYSPDAFVQASRPPWFERGRQQDCSEFLRYLLAILLEQEKRSVSTSASAFKSCNEPYARGLDSAESQPCDDLMDKDPSSVIGSTSALNAILEAPEDEDMSSQDSGGMGQHEEMFGSRCSLEVMTDDAKETSDCDSEEPDLLSRASLKRWTTEENLAAVINKSDLTASGIIHDSHSDSTDSGIQSVGDSVMGSIDCVPGSSRDVVTSSGAAQSKDRAGDPEARVGNHSEPQSVEHRVFGGKMQTTYQCCHCHAVSVHKEYFNDLLIPFPEATDAGGNQGQTKLTMQNLIRHYFHSERLQGENQYQCEKCCQLQDAMKTITILESPQHLICTLMRFKYERKLNRKVKILTDIEYDMNLQVPVLRHDGLSVDDVMYSLYAVVVHSGYSSDSGHYYTYARQPLDLHRTTADADLDQASRQHDASSTWYIFNDDSVSSTTFDTFVNMRNKFQADTAYVLFYQKVAPSKVKPDDWRPQLLRQDLQLLVERDNIQYLRKLERSSFKTSDSSQSKPQRRKEDEDEDDQQGPGPGSRGTSCTPCQAFDCTTRFIC